MFHLNMAPEALAQIERRREHAVRQADCDWAELVEVVTSLGNAPHAELAAGTETTDPRMLELARQWRALLDHFTGGGDKLPALSAVALSAARLQPVIDAPCDSMH
jgi:hypothetical protein